MHVKEYESWSQIISWEDNSSDSDSARDDAQHFDH